MSKIGDLVARYEYHIGAPWPRTLAGAQRVTMVVYPKERERVLRVRIHDFEQATRRTGHGWRGVDCTPWFAEWMAAEEYRDAYFEDPELLETKLEEEFSREAARRLANALDREDDNTVVTLFGVAALYGFLRVSELALAVEPSIRGRLVVFFPGTKNDNNYRLLDARDGWNYLAQAITLNEGWVP